MSFARSKPGFLDRTKPSFLERRAAPPPEPEPQIPDSEPGPDPEDPPDQAEVPAGLKAFRERNEAERNRFKEATDTECWVAIAFRNRADKDAFIAEFGLIDHPMIPGTPGNKYVNGYSLAESLRKRTT